MSVAYKLPITAAEYLEGERGADVRHEFLDGRIYDLCGDSLRHNQIAGETALSVKAHLCSGPCRTFIESVKVQICDDLGEAFYYPDVFVTCEPADDDSHVVRHPKLIIEVLSPSTAAYDRGEKFDHYTHLPSLKAYVLVDCNRENVVLYTPGEDETWVRRVHEAGDTVRISVIEVELPVGEIYAGWEEFRSVG